MVLNSAVRNKAMLRECTALTNWLLGLSEGRVCDFNVAMGLTNVSLELGRICLRLSERNQFWKHGCLLTCVEFAYPKVPPEFFKIQFINTRLEGL